jgi:hypothetical protein
MSRLLKYDDLGIYCSNNRRLRGINKELWMVEEEYQLIPIDNIIRPISVWLKDLPEPMSCDFYVSEILYRDAVTNRMKIRPVNLRHRHPSEYIALPNPPPLQHMKVFKFMIDIYNDDFGTYRNVYHSLGGIYIQIGNMPFSLRKQLKNHFVIGFIPFGGHFDDVMQPLLEELRHLEKGVAMTMNNETVWVIASIGLVTADMPQGNDLCDVKKQGALYGCRNCLTPKDHLTDDSFDKIHFSRFHHITKEHFIELQRLIDQNATKTEIKNFAIRYGLRSKPGVLSVLSRDRHLQTPQDAYHAVAGKIQRLLDCTLNILNENGKIRFLKYWRSFEKPSIWHCLPNPITHRQSFMFSDALQLAMLMPFILKRFLTSGDINSTDIAALCNRLPSSNNRRCSPIQAINAIVSCWVTVADAAAYCFKLSLTTHHLNHLQDILMEERRILLEVRYKSY